VSVSECRANPVSSLQVDRNLRSVVEVAAAVVGILHLEEKERRISNLFRGKRKKSETYIVGHCSLQ